MPLQNQHVIKLPFTDTYVPSLLDYSHQAVCARLVFSWQPACHTKNLIATPIYYLGPRDHEMDACNPAGSGAHAAAPKSAFSL